MKMLLFILFNKFLIQQRLQGIKKVNIHSYILFFSLISLIGGPFKNYALETPHLLTWIDNLFQIFSVVVTLRL